MTKLARISVFAVVLSACGGSDGPNLGPETAPTPSQQAAVTSTARDLSLLAMASVQGEAAGGAAISFAFTAQALLANTTTATALPGLADAAQAVARAAAQRQVAPDGCEVVTANSITWNHCVDNGDTIDGTMSWSTGHVEIDIHVTATSQSLQLDYAISGSVTFSELAIQGDVMVSFSLTGGGSTSSETLHSQIDVQLMDGCIFHGTLTVTETGSGPGARSGAVQVVWSNCGVFRVRNG